MSSVQVNDLSAGAAPTTELTEGEDSIVTAAPNAASGRAEKFAGAPVRAAAQDDERDLVAAAPFGEHDDDALILEPIGTKSAMLGDNGPLLPKQLAGMRSLAATRTTGGSSSGIDGLQLLQVDAFFKLQHL